MLLLLFHKMLDNDGSFSAQEQITEITERSSYHGKKNFIKLLIAIMETRTSLKFADWYVHHKKFLTKNS
jgi:hypothetical protein